MEDNVRKRMCICMCDWVTLLYSKKLIENCKPTIMEKIKIIKKIKIIFVLEKKKKRNTGAEGEPVNNPYLGLIPDILNELL